MSSKLIDRYLSGNSAKHIVDAVLEELPPMPALRSSIQRILPKTCKVSIEDSVVTLEHKDKRTLHETIGYLSLAYPELEFVVK